MVGKGYNCVPPLVALVGQARSFDLSRHMFETQLLRYHPLFFLCRPGGTDFSTPLPATALWSRETEFPRGATGRAAKGLCLATTPSPWHFAAYLTLACAVTRRSP